MGRGLTFGRGAAEGPMACWAIGEGEVWGCTAKDELLGLGVADDDSIIVTSVDGWLAVVPCPNVAKLKL